MRPKKEKRKEVLLHRLDKFEKGWNQKNIDFRMPFREVRNKVLEYFEQTGKYSLRYGRLTLEFKDWLYHNSPRFTIHRPP